MTGVAKKASLIFQSVPRQWEAGCEKEPAVSTGASQAGDDNGATAGGTACCVPLENKNKREKKEIKRPACQSGAKSASWTVRGKGLGWFPIGNRV